jgi:plasmid stability protein
MQADDFDLHSYSRENTMANVLIREIDERDLELLKRKALASGRSLQGELKRILEMAARASDEETARAVAERVSAALSGREHPDSAKLIRKDRDR